MDQTMLVMLAGLLGFVLIAAVGFVFAGGDSGQAKTLKRAAVVTGQVARDRSRTKAAVAADPGARRKALLQTMKEQEKAARKASLSLGARLRQAGLSVTETHFWIASGVLAVVAFLAALLLGGKPWIGIPAAFAAGLGVPRWVLGFLAKRRTKKFTEHFSDAIDVIVRGIKSGLPVHDCLKIIARESPAPLGPEFQKLVENIGMGLDIAQALEKMYERMPTSELRFFTIVLAIQQKTGGNLAEALGNLSTVLRSRKLMREKIKALSSEAVTSAFIIGSLPPIVITLISLTSPAYMAIMYTDPRGQMLMLGCATTMALGIFVMKRMIAFKF